MRKCSILKKQHVVKLTTVQIIALQKAVEAACWNEVPFKGFGRTRRAHAVLAVETALLPALTGRTR